MTDSYLIPQEPDTAPLLFIQQGDTELNQTGRPGEDRGDTQSVTGEKEICVVGCISRVNFSVRSTPKTRPWANSYAQFQMVTRSVSSKLRRLARRPMLVL